MSAKAVQFVLVVRYNLSAHRATYGRLQGPPSTYTKDYLQLSRKQEFLSAIDGVLRLGSEHSTRLIYRWPNGGSALGAFVHQSADRPHLSWETSAGAPAPWRMTPRPAPGTVETIPGNPSHEDPSTADAEFSRLSERGAGQPYLVAVKLAEEENTFHLRVYVRDAAPSYAWADFGLLPDVVQDIAPSSSSRAAFGWTLIPSGSVYFDLNKHHDAWRTAGQMEEVLQNSSLDVLQGTISGPARISDDASAETLVVDEQQVEKFESQIKAGYYSVPDSSATVKTRGSAQRAFSKEVRSNYSGSCAITGISTGQFLVAAHIVPWSKDETIRLDPANGICLSLLVDKAFELGFLRIEDDLSVLVDWQRVGSDAVLGDLLRPYDGLTLRLPTNQPPNVDYLRRRRELVETQSRTGSREASKSALEAE